VKEDTNNETNAVKAGKPWDILGYYETYEEASTARTEIVASWEAEKKEGMESKIKLRRQPRRFVVKIRLHPDFDQKPSKKSKKKKEKTK
jgi:hypothetical protein|tara:strand:- start:1739 stop:2005 length:267 start_codon:yes stop_codon:yes gene_type:complete